ncbi:unnamed protein product [Lactuca virosa]|uniref:Uncharacterized protein n=1 Tax=Lactuca virosa TaxID=75947 RepID=A0AAU9NSI5_9ASTR|nr:unnamed protein product [Lactuca virosa]
MSVPRLLVFLSSRPWFILYPRRFRYVSRPVGRLYRHYVWDLDIEAQMDRWNKALTGVADLKGKDANGRLEVELIDEIVNDIFRRLRISSSVLKQKKGTENVLGLTLDMRMLEKEKLHGSRLKQWIGSFSKDKRADFLNERRVVAGTLFIKKKKTEIQMYYEFGIFSTIYGGQEMPNWITDRNMGPSISFTIPSSPNNLTGLNFSYKVPNIKTSKCISELSLKGSLAYWRMAPRPKDSIKLQLQMKLHHDPLFL